MALAYMYFIIYHVIAGTNHSIFNHAQSSLIVLLFVIAHSAIVHTALNNLDVVPLLS